MDQRFKLDVAEPGSTNFDDGAVITTGSTQSPVFRISCIGHDKLRLIIPVLNERTPENQKVNMLVNKDTWQAITLKTDNLINATIGKEASLPGVIELSSVNNKVAAEAVFTLSHFTALADPGTASCYLRYQKLVVIDPTDPDDLGSLEWVDAPASTITVTKTEKIEYPVITSFTADRYIISTGETAHLSWKTEKSDYCQFSINDTLQNEQSADGSFSEPNVPKDGAYRHYTLKACTKKSKDYYDAKKVSISVKGTSLSETCGFPSADVTLMGLYPYEDNLYAIVLHKKPQVKAYLYASQSGMMDWRQVFRYPDQPVELDARLAGSPGVVFRDRLYLIGGSSFDTDRPGSDIGYYNFETKEWVSSAQMSGRHFPTARMGHACLVYGDEIWLLGGYDPARGTLNDIWTTKNGIAWTEAAVGGKKITLPGAGRCMPGAVVHANELWIFGGFKAEPGGEPYSYNDTCLWDGKSWSGPLDWSTAARNSLKNDNYKAVALASVKESLFLFSTYLSTEGWKHLVSRIYKGNRWEIHNEGYSHDWGMDEYGYSLQTTVYKSTVWIRALRPAGSKEAGVSGKELYYFYYVPSK
ncbi:MAG: hypothetical protein ABW019_00620 [Chitinophagaceae bacterium]